MSELDYDIAIVGGGITGLVAAYTLQKYLQHQANHPFRVLLLEAVPGLGGKIQSIEFAGTTIDTGAEAFVAQAGRQLCIDLGLENQLLAPLSSQTNIWTRNRIRPLPGGLAMGIPTNPLPIAQSGILSPLGLLRAGLDLILPRIKLPPDPTIAQVIGSRLGSDLLNHLVEPLIGGIHAGRADRLSLAAVAPQLASTAQKHRSLILGLRPKKSSQNPPIKSTIPQLLTFEKGLTTLIDRLHLSSPDIDIRTSTPLRTLYRNEDGSYRLLCENGEVLSVASLVLATPASNTADLLQDLLPEISSKLQQIEHAAVMVTHLAYRPSALPAGRLQGTGFLVPRANGKLMNACTCINNKWPRQFSSDLFIFRCSAGRAGDDRASVMGDEELSHTLHQELVEALGLREQPVQTTIARWPSAFPQYTSGYQACIKHMEQILAERTPGLFLAGAPYHGLGLASCIKDGSQVARHVLDYLEPSPEQARYQNRIIPGPFL